ncbi:hypothetical protein [Streptomyces fructofermentans]|uniref:Uncharacterized protein n=1 Tax=Streptomyces fructofermentans TaxID=152141 RepID=A0A918NVF5_9ACTN|nr:hypothetical protein [Streptomyces fructofermentans]GGX99720.1 hypothetical protein GCM10010515_77220 [Streptomyces fructofermentans]
MSGPPDVPPSDWPGLETGDVVRLTDDVYYGWLEHEVTPVFWHRCAALADVPAEHTVHGRWVAAGTSGHTLVAREPLHLEPSLLWKCCGLHGWVRDGQWTSA